MQQKLLEIYQKLLKSYGYQAWWPGEGIEIAIGAILTQNTNWKNVEKVLVKLKQSNCMSLNCLLEIPIEKLENLIQSAGYFRVKAQRLKNFAVFLENNPQPTREELLEVNGIGPETADSILNYMFNEPIFVVDSYTFRIFERLGLYQEKSKYYHKLQKIFMDNLPNDTKLFKEYHALIVRHAQNHCFKKEPLCKDCPLIASCEFGR